MRLQDKKNEVAMWKRLLLLIALVGSTAGCFEIQGEHTLYLAPDGTVAWIVLEEEIRFDVETREARRLEEEAFLDRVAAGEHGAAVALGSLRPASLGSRILREETPLAILTEARYPGIDRVYQNLFDLYGVVASTELRTRDDRTRLLVTFWPDHEEKEESDEDEAEDAYDEILLALLLQCRIVLTEGTFVDAVGFEILEGGQAAKPTEIDTEESKENNTPVVLSLSWTTVRELSDAEGGP